MQAGNLMIVQGGGPTAVFNASLAAILEEARSRGIGGRIYGSYRGVRGLVHGEVLELDGVSPAALQMLRQSPGAALGSSRYKPTDEEFGKILRTLRRLDVRRVIFMGGNGTMRGAAIVSETCRAAGFEVQVIGVPKTIDNDLAVTDRSPGYASAARYVAQSTRDLGMDIRALPQPVSILETLGRNVGWLAAASALARRSADDAPHLIYFSEAAFSEEQFLGDVDDVVRRQGWCVVVVSEGLRKADGSPVYQMSAASQLDGLGRAMTGGVGQYLAGVVSSHLGMRCRNEAPGLLGRSCGSQVAAQDLADADLVGRAGVAALAADEHERMVSLLPLGQSNGPGYELVPLTAAAGIERPFPVEWMKPGPANISEAFRQYLEPLVGPLREYLPPLKAITLEKEPSNYA